MVNPNMVTTFLNCEIFDKFGTILDMSSGKQSSADDRSNIYQIL